MPIPALLVPALLSIGLKVALKVAKSALKPDDAPPVQVAQESFDNLLKDQQSRLPAQAVAVTTPMAELSTPTDLIARLGHDQGVRSLALGLQARLHMPSPPIAPGGDARRVGATGRLAARLHLDSRA
jgi:hypothetical protein